MLNKFVPTPFAMFWILVIIAVSVALAEGKPASNKLAKPASETKAKPLTDWNKERLQWQAENPLFPTSARKRGFDNPNMNLVVLIVIGVALCALALAVKMTFITLIFSFVRSGFHAKLNPFKAIKRRKQLDSIKNHYLTRKQINAMAERHRRP